MMRFDNSNECMNTSQCLNKFNNVTVENSNKYYAYKAYIKKVLNSDDTNVNTTYPN